MFVSTACILTNEISGLSCWFTIFGTRSNFYCFFQQTDFRYSVDLILAYFESFCQVLAISDHIMPRDIIRSDFFHLLANG